MNAGVDNNEVPRLPLATSLLLCCFLTCNGRLETSSSREARHCRCCDFEFRACLRIASSTGSTLGGLEGAKTYEGDGIPLATALTTAAKIASSALPAAALLMSASVATASINSDFFINIHWVG